MKFKRINNMSKLMGKTTRQWHMGKDTKANRERIELWATSYGRDIVYMFKPTRNGVAYIIEA